MAEKAQTKSSITPFVALIALMVYSVFIACPWHLYVPMLLPLFYLMVLYRFYLWKVLKTLFFLNTLVALIVLTLVIQHDYTMAVLIFCRSNIILLFSLLLFCDKDEFSVAMAMHDLNMPPKLVSVFFFTTKSIFLLKYEVIHFKKTLVARGFELKTNLISYRILAGCVGILVIKAIERAYHLQQAMIIRNFNGRIYTLHPSHRLQKVDILLIFSILLAILWQQGRFI